MHIEISEAHDTTLSGTWVSFKDAHGQEIRISPDVVLALTSLAEVALGIPTEVVLAVPTRDGPPANTTSVEASSPKECFGTFPGATSDFVRYELGQLAHGMRGWRDRVQKMGDVMDARHTEHVKMLNDVVQENKKLREQLKSTP
jgi:hypothetical protein